jgi:hypothetical protein
MSSHSTAVFEASAENETSAATPAVSTTPRAMPPHHGEATVAWLVQMSLVVRPSIAINHRRSVAALMDSLDGEVHADFGLWPSHAAYVLYIPHRHVDMVRAMLLDSISVSRSPFVLPTSATPGEAKEARLRVGDGNAGRGAAGR